MEGTTGTPVDDGSMSVDLCDDLWLRVFVFASWGDRSALAATCRRFRRIVGCDAACSEFMRRFGEEHVVALNVDVGMTPRERLEFAYKSTKDTNKIEIELAVVESSEKSFWGTVSRLWRVLRSRQPPEKRARDLYVARLEEFLAEERSERRRSTDDPCLRIASGARTGTWLVLWSVRDRRFHGAHRDNRWMYADSFEYVFDGRRFLPVVMDFVDMPDWMDRLPVSAFYRPHERRCGAVYDWEPQCRCDHPPSYVVDFTEHAASLRENMKMYVPVLVEPDWTSDPTRRMFKNHGALCFATWFRRRGKTYNVVGMYDRCFGVFGKTVWGGHLVPARSTSLLESGLMDPFVPDEREHPDLYDRFSKMTYHDTFLLTGSSYTA